MLDWQDKKDSLLAKSDRETAIAPIRVVPPPIPPIPLQSVQVSVPPLAEIAACKKCAALEERVSHLETKAAIGDDSMERYSLHRCQLRLVMSCNLNMNQVDYLYQEPGIGNGCPPGRICSAI